MQREMHRKRLPVLISLTAALFVAGESFHYFRGLLYPLLGFTVVITILFFIMTMRRIRARLRGMTGIYLPLIITMLLFVIAINRSGLPVQLFYYELFNMGVIGLIIFLQILLIKNRDDLLKHRDQFFRILFYLVTAISVMALIRFALHLWGIALPDQLVSQRVQSGTTLTHNPDTFIIAPVAAMIGILLFKFRQKTTFGLNLLYHFSFLLIFYTIIWSGSGNALLIMIGLVAMLVVTRVFFLFHHSRKRNYNLIKNLNVIILVVGFSAVLGSYLFFVVPGKQKDLWIARMNLESYHVKSEVTLITFAHIKTFNHTADLQKWYERLWGQEDQDKGAMRDRISFILTEQENLFMAPEPEKWHRKVLDYRLNQLQKIRDLFNEYSPRERWFGKGYGYLKDPGFIPTEATSVVPTNLAHNYLVNTLLASGIVGVGFLFWLLLSVLGVFWVNRKRLLALYVLFVVTATLYLLIPNTFLSCPLLLFSMSIPLRYRKAKDIG